MVERLKIVLKTIFLSLVVFPIYIMLIVPTLILIGPYYIITGKNLMEDYIYGLCKLVTEVERL
jgi:hypothetical protein